MGFLKARIDRRSYIQYTLLTLAVRLLLVTPVVFYWFNARAFSPIAYAIALAADALTLIAFVILNARRLATLGEPLALSLLTFLPVVKIILAVYLAVRQPAVNLSTSSTINP